VRRIIIGDVHGCADELDKLLEKASPEKTFLIGDLFTKGPDPIGVWQLIQAHHIQSVLGNHDAFLIKNWASSSLPASLQRFCETCPEVLAWLQALPLFINDEDLTIVHAGIHPLLGVPGTTEEMALTMRRFPMDKPKAPFWYDAGWNGPQTVVFGHDARRGLVRREKDGSPVAIGLDTGCVYGGKLSGWIPEDDKVISIQAARIYRPV